MDSLFLVVAGKEVCICRAEVGRTRRACVRVCAFVLSTRFLLLARETPSELFCALCAALCVVLKRQEDVAQRRPTGGHDVSTPRIRTLRSVHSVVSRTLKLRPPHRVVWVTVTVTRLT